MRLETSILEIEVLLNRIRQARIDLQPDFQRASIWTTAKKQRLIDSVLRKWHVPPLHFVREDSGHQLVLDGQQRLTAIWEFSNDRFPVNGRIDPLDHSVATLHGARFSQLPESARRRFLEFQVQTVNISDYSAEEPFELFFRLNEPVSLTSAEKRNAFFGLARDQVRHLVRVADNAGWSKDTIGFTNLRMAYDDVLARLCLTLELRSLRAQLPGSAVTKKYRSGEGFDEDVVEIAESSLVALVGLFPVRSRHVRFNRATLFSWLIFLARLEMGARLNSRIDEVGHYLEWFEEQRLSLKKDTTGISERQERLILRDAPFVPALLSVYDDRASARVLDANSVLARDLVICALYALRLGHSRLPVGMVEVSSFLDEVKQASSPSRTAFEFLEHSSWGTW